MSSFVATPPAPASNVEIAGDGWWPGLSVAAFQASMRLQRDVAAARCRDALVAAWIEIARELAAWRAARESEGAEDLAAVAGLMIDGEREHVILWRRAVYALAAADLADTHSDISATEAGKERTEERAASADELRRNAVQAARRILGRSRNRIALK